MTTPDRAGRLPIHYAAVDDKVKLLQELIAAGQDVNAQEGQGWTPLHFAADGGNLEIAQILLDSGADPNRTNLRDDTPLDLAIASPISTATEVAKLIFLRGGDPLHEDRFGNTALNFVRTLKDGSRGKDELLELFRQHGIVE